MSGPSFYGVPQGWYLSTTKAPRPTPNTNDDIKQSPAEGGITVRGVLEQLNGDSVRSHSLSFRQREDGALAAAEIAVAAMMRLSVLKRARTLVQIELIYF